MVATAHDTPPNTRQRILQAALEAFSERGFDGATTRDIAARADVNLGLIKYYFDSKLKLWRAAVDAAFETLSGALAGGLDDGPVLDRREHTSTLIRRYVRFVAAHPEFVRLMHDEGKRGGPRMRWLVDRHVRPMYERLTAVFGDAQQRGLLPPGIDPLHWHYILAGSVGLIFHQAEECKRLTGLDPAEEAMVEAHADAVVHLLLGREENP
jgi:AcrR family transcriptional regulator